MARFLTLLLCTLCTISFAVAAPLPSATFHAPGTGAALDVSRTSPAHTSIALHGPSISVATHTVGFENFQSFAMEGEAPKPVEGSPAVPMVSRLYRIPNTGSAELLINEADYEVMDNINPLPYQEEYTDAPVSRDGQVYSKNGWYPANVAEMSAPIIMRDFRVVQVTLYPVQVNPVTHQARIYRNLSVDVVANDTPGENELTHPRRPSGDWAAMYRSMIANLDESALDDITTSPGAIMIFTKTDSTSKRWADSLAEWKTRRGYKVDLRAQTSWTSQAVHDQIVTAYQNWQDPPLEYVVLIGSPSFGVPDHSSQHDHYYANMTAGDDYEDLGVGRLYGGASSEIGVMLSKTLRYERDPHMESSPGVADTAWFHKAFFAACTNFSCASNYTLMQWGASQFQQFTGLTTTEVMEFPDCNTVTACAQRISQGIGFFGWRGTMQQDASGIGPASNPAGRYPISITITCSSEGTARSLAVSGTYTNPKGCVTSIGTIGPGTHNPQNITVAGGFMYNVASLGVEHPGDAAAGARAQLFLSSQTYAQDFTYWNNLYGDPSLSIWTDVPKVLSVTHPTSLNVGARSVDVIVRRQGDDQLIADAVVCLWKKSPDSTWVVGTTDVNGHIVLPVSVNSAGNMWLTVTKRNCKPYLANIACGTTDCMPMVCYRTLDDDNTGGTQGNNDGVMNPGEVIDLRVYVKNFGVSATATNIGATLTSLDPRVTVATGTATYANLAPGDSALGDQPFRIQVSPALPHNQTVLLGLAITSSSGPTSGVIELDCVSGALAYVSLQCTGFAPGLTRDLTVTVRNTGVLPLSGLTGHLESLSPFVTVPAGVRPFGAIAPNAQGSNSANPFSVSAHPLAYQGLQAPMLLVMNGDNGFVDSMQFNITIGTKSSTDPVGPDMYGYYAYDNTDVSYPLHPEFNYVNISQGLGQNLNLNDVGEKVSTSTVWSTTRVLPFHFKFYGKSYDTLTICSNGWVAFGNQSWNDMFRNYRIPGMQAPDAMIAPYWDDLKTNSSGQGVWAYYNEDSGRYIVQWKATSTNGTTPLDFEVMLYDSVARPSMDGNGYVLVQYNQIAMNQPNNQDYEPNGCTIGIQAPGGRVGLEYAYIMTYAPGAAPIATNRAILFTTDATMLAGSLEGQVLDAETNQPLEGVVVATDRYGRRDTTDANGHYMLEAVLIGTYDIFAGKYRFNGDTATEIIITEDDTTHLNFSLHHPEMRLSATAIVDSAVDTPVQATFDIINDGNGPLDYSSQIFYAGDENTTPWDSVGAIPVTQTTTDPQIWGCEFLYDQWWVTGASGLAGAKVIYRFARDGSLLGQIPQPATTPLGWFDMATDGQFLYGSDGPGIVKIDVDHGVVLGTIPSPINPTRAIAYDPVMDYFWVADYTSDIYAIDRMGNVMIQFPNRGTNPLLITGLAWNANDPSGYKLYAFSRNGSTSQIRVTRIHPMSGLMETAADLHGMPGDNAAGCTITSNWNSALTVFAAVLRNPTGCRLGLFEMAFNQSWISLMPASATVPGGSSQTVTVTFNPATLNNATYNLRAHLSSAAYDTLFNLPITLTVGHIVGTTPRSVDLPKDYALYQNYPNPFNPTTEIRFDLPRAEHVRMKVYNALGQEVANLVDDVRSAGTYTVHWDGSRLASGLYLCRIEAGRYTQVRKMLLMK